MAERYGDELRDALPEVDLVAGFGAELTDPSRRRAARRARWPFRRAPCRRAGAGDERVRPPGAAPSRRPRPLGLREGRRGLRPHLRLLRHPVVPGQAALPFARGDAGRGGRAARPPTARRYSARSSSSPRTWPPTDGTARGRGGGPHRQRPLAHRRPHPRRAARVERTRLLYLYPSGLTDELIETVLSTGVPYFDLSLQHVARPLLARMRRWGDGDRFLRRIADIRAADPDATFRSSFILGYPGETERDHDLLLEFLEAAQLDWAGFFPFSREDGTHAAGLDTRCRPGSHSSVCASVPSCRTPSPRPSATPSSA